MTIVDSCHSAVCAGKVVTDVVAPAERNRVIRALAAFVALPGVVGYLVPVLVGLADRGADGSSFGLLLVGASSALLGWCTVEFYRAGKGTLAPWAPPQELVMTGPYAWSRNPMYVAVVMLALGWALWLDSNRLLYYAGALAIAFQLRITLHEEPRLANAFPAQWSDYRARVRRWI